MTEEQQSVEAEAGVALDQPVEAPSGDSSQPVPEPEQQFDIGGEQVPLSQLRDGYLRQSDYTRKTQEISQQRDSLKPYVELADYLKANPNHAQNIYGYLQGNQGALDGTADPKDMEISQIKTQMNALMGNVGKIEATRIIGEVNSDPKYGGMFKSQTMEDMLLSVHMQKGRQADLKSTADEIFKELNKIKTESKMEGESKVINNLKSPTRKGTVGQGTMTPPKGFNPGTASWSDVEAKAEELL